ncbi:MAG: hypothetical protein U5L01_01965 [Rheinheimera sp.]|nr:hypothetical protein [Rheinheimera sp.]
MWVQQQAKEFELNETPKWQSVERQLIEFHLTIEQHLKVLQEYVAAETNE